MLIWVSRHLEIRWIILNITNLYNHHYPSFCWAIRWLSHGLTITPLQALEGRAMETWQRREYFWLETTF